ncbi:Holliday junction DNA helicase RuvB C-terminal domain-containing protein [Planctomycetota bacterium]
MDKKKIRSDVNQAEPMSLAHIKGQSQVIGLISVHLQAHFNIRSLTGDDNQPFGPVALVGPSGTGKTMVAKAIHAELGNIHLFHSNGETINSRNELFPILLNADKNATVFIDEAQGMSAKTQNILLTAISERFLPITFGTLKHRRGIPLEPFTLILATTHEYLLKEALRNRMRIYCRFQSYSIPELMDILIQCTQVLGWQYESAEVIEIVAKRAKGNARQALNRYLQTCWQVAKSHDHDSIEMTDLEQAFDQMQIDELGLDEIDRQYLRILSDDRAVPLNVISSKLGLPSKTVSNIIESYLIREGFITKDKYSMRVLTAKGSKHIENNSRKDSHASQEN